MRRFAPRARQGFTLIEVMLVVAFIALMATMVLPKRLFSLESPMNALQRTVAEISDLALDGNTVRLRVDFLERSDRGQIWVEALTKVPDRFQADKHTLEWQPLKVRYPLQGEDWRLEPEIVYFYSDGTCTPARILRAPKDESITEGEAVLLTVTGFLFEEKSGTR